VASLSRASLPSLRLDNDSSRRPSRRFRHFRRMRANQLNTSTWI
jgi:hypothetical protein